ncbi:hypothetical protein M885DRAFT_550593 [Pelagophyceae sp. CCMP2097]|nr:hypothetical protein M885DRAFT_550593 [Pelagophyceae sp. CCMP2097]
MTLSPLRTYREFVTKQKDDADANAFARRYNDYRREYAKLLMQRFFERNADFEWFRERYDPLLLSERVERRRGRAAGEAAAFKAAFEAAPADFAASADLDPRKEADDDENEDDVIAASSAAEGAEASDDDADAAEDDDEKPKKKRKPDGAGLRSALDFEESAQALAAHRAAHVVLIPQVPPAVGLEALGAALAAALEEAGLEKVPAPTAILMDDAAARRRDGFETDAWLLYDDAATAARVEKALGDARLAAVVPPALATAALPWDKDSVLHSRAVCKLALADGDAAPSRADADAMDAGDDAVGGDEGDDAGGGDDDAEARGGGGLPRGAARHRSLVVEQCAKRASRLMEREVVDREIFSARAKRALLAASTGGVDDLGRSARARRAPKTLNLGRASGRVSERRRLVFDAEQALRLAAALDEAAQVPPESRLGALLADALRDDAKHRFDVAAAYLRRVHLFLYYGALQCRDEVELLTKDAVWLTRRDAAEAPLEGERELLDEARAAADGAAPAPAADDAAPEDAAAASKDDAADDEAPAAAKDDDDDDAAADDDDLQGRKRRRDSVASDADAPELATKRRRSESEGGAAGGAASGARGSWGQPLNELDGKIARRLTRALNDAEGGGGGGGPVGGKAQANDGGACARAWTYRCTAELLRLAAAERAELEGSTRAFIDQHATLEDSDRARCGFEWCHKLFKSHDFLQKHVVNRHKEYYDAWQTVSRRPFMFELYERDAKKPLPPVRTDHGPEVEPLELLASGADRRGGGGPASGRGYGGGKFDRRDDRYGDRRGGDGKGRGRGRGDGDRRYDDHGGKGRRDGKGRGKGDFSRPAPRVPGAGDKPDPRKLTSYADADAVSRPEIKMDFGVLLPPQNKKKKKQKVTPPTIA